MSTASCTITYEEQSDFNISKRMKQKEQHGEIFKIAPFSLLSHTFALCLYKRGDAISLLPSANGSPNLTQAQSKEATYEQRPCAGQVRDLLLLHTSENTRIRRLGNWRHF